MLSQRRKVPVALWLWYRGDRFRGFQRQIEGPTVQSTLEQALAAIGEKRVVMPAGRTDRGVHARMQVVSFAPKQERSEAEWIESLGRALPDSMGVCAARVPPGRFHAQWSCVGKQYRYRIDLGAAPSWRSFSWRPATHPRLEGRACTPERIEALLHQEVGTRDFIAFHAKSSVRKPRTLEAATLREIEPGLFEATLTGDGFGRYQVRFLIGNAVATACGLISPEQFTAALETGTAIEGIRAPPEGLVLWEVRYPPDNDPFLDLQIKPPILSDLFFLR